MNKIVKLLRSTPLSVVVNLLWVYVAFTVTRLAFLWLNDVQFHCLTAERIFALCVAGLRFDTAAILYTNLLYLVLMLLPLHFKECKGYHRGVKWWFVGSNFVAVAANLVDAVYFPYAMRRTTASVFSQFANEDNLWGIFGIELLNNWYLVLLAVALGVLLYKGYRTPHPDTSDKTSYYAVFGVSLLVAAGVAVVGMRGGVGRDVRPITISNANQYVDRPTEAAVVLNTPFAIYRTLGKKPFITPHYFDNEEEMETLYTPVHQPKADAVFRPKNVCVLVLESFGKEYFGSLNPTLEGGNYKGYTPFLDSLIRKSLVWEYSFANGQQSIDGLPSVLSGIPRFVEPFFLTPASMNRLTSVGGELKKKGYYTAFFHGARNGSMGFQAYSRAVGYDDYFGREDYGNDADFDGKWAIWDEEFLQFFADKISSFPQPFSVGIFTASSHHPFNVPERYESVFQPGTLPIHRCIRYSDYALKRFFETASKQEWFHNTLFVLTADHTNQKEHDIYLTDAGKYSVPIIFYTPDGELQGHREAIAQQIDIMPTILGYLGYDAPFVSFGCNLLDTPAEDTFAVNHNNGIYQYFKGDYMLQFDGEKAVALYNFKTDPLLQKNLVGELEVERQMTLELKSMIQQYMYRMNNDQMTL